MTPPALHFIPLGGSGEIGMNLNLYGHDDAWLMVDCGLGFERAEVGEDRIVAPDPRFAAALASKLVGLVITHVHLDHLGAVDMLWPRLRCPVHCTPFAAAVLRRRLMDANLLRHVPIEEHRIGARWRLGPFDLEFVGLTHSTAESAGLVVRTPAATVFHTGDYKLDPDPTLGAVSDEGRLRALGDLGVDVVVGDSTNATREGHSRSEAQVAAHLDTLVAQATGRVVVGTFSSHVARIRTLARLAVRHGRVPILLGRSMLRMADAAREVGLFDDVPRFGSLHDAATLPRHAVLFIATGTQGESRSALDRLSRDDHPRARLEGGDTVVFSSKIIPGNEAPIARLHAGLRGRGIHVIHEGEDPDVHASGHPCRDELRALYGWLRPGCVVPVHGEARHMEAHAELARSLDLGVVSIRNGGVAHLGPGPARLLPETVHTGRLVR